MSRRNLIANPRFWANATDGWGAADADLDVTRVTSVAGVTLPDGANACAKIVAAADPERSAALYWLSDAISVDAGVWLAQGVSGYIPTGTALMVGVVFHDGSHANVGSSSYTFGGTYDYGRTAFHRHPPVGEETAPNWGIDTSLFTFDHIHIEVAYQDVGELEAYITLLSLDDESGGNFLGYADGDSLGWQWESTRHNSRSLLVRGVPGLVTYTTSDLEVVVASPGGQTCKITDEISELEVVLEENAGYKSCSFEVDRDARAYYEELAPFGDLIVRWGGRPLFEGRLIDPTIEPWQQRLNARGGVDTLMSDDEVFRRCFADSDCSKWQEYQQLEDETDTIIAGNSGNFDVRVTEDRIAIEMPNDAWYRLGHRSRVYYWLFDGLNVIGERIRRLQFTYKWDQDSSTSDIFHAYVLSKSDPDAGNIAVAWERIADQASWTDVNLTEADLDPASGGAVRCVVFQVKAVEPWGSYGFRIDDDEWKGLRVKNVLVNGVPGAPFSPEEIVANLAGTAGFDATHRDFPDASGVTTIQMCFDQPGTIAEAILQVNESLAWDLGCREGGVFYFRKPYTAMTVPADKLYVAPYGLWAPYLRADASETYNVCTVGYQTKKGLQKQATSSLNSAALGSITRKRHITAPGEVTTAYGAGRTADAFLADHSEPLLTGEAPMSGLVPLASGGQRHALLMWPGEMIQLQDAPPERRGPHRISRLTLRPQDEQTAVEIGSTPWRLSRRLARLTSRTRRRTSRR